jgi:GNAT superfamily N-acetyltransferase
VHAIRGPANPSLNYECGLLVEGFDTPPVFMMTYNPDYYPRLIEQCGFDKTHDLLAFTGSMEQLPEVRGRLAGIVAGARERGDVHVRPLNLKRFARETALFLEMWNRSLIAMWGFVPLSRAEFKHMAAAMKMLVIPEMALAAEVNGQPIGMVVALPDYNPCIKRIDGRLFPFGFLTLLAAKRRVKRVRVVAINVVPEYQRWGVGLLLLDELVPKLLDLKIEEVEFSWVSEANTMARKGLEKGGARRYKTYRMYDWALRS